MAGLGGTMTTRDIWHLGERYERVAAQLQQRNARLLAGMLGAVDGLDVLELGCGTGLLTEQLARLPGIRSLTGIDRSPGMLREAQRKAALSNVELVCASLFDYEPPRRFDRILSNAAFHWLYPEYRGALDKLASLLSDGGAIYLATAGRTQASESFGPSRRRGSSSPTNRSGPSARVKCARPTRQTVSAASSGGRSLTD